MTSRRNVEGLGANARRKRADALARAQAAIRDLVRRNRTVNFTAVADAAGVSTAWLYRQDALKARIIELRGKGTPNTTARRHERASDSAKDAIIATLRHRIKELGSENAALRRQIETLYGGLLESGHRPTGS
jgi:Family of unknown function (DUF6262)